MKIVRLNHSQYARFRSNRMALITLEGEFVRFATEDEAASFEVARRRGTVTKVREKYTDPEDQVVERILVFTTDREVLKKELLALHGSCRVMLFNGKQLFDVRDPNVSRISPPPKPEVHHITPERCQCAKWGGRQAGKHHPACQFNKLAPPEFQGHPREQILDAVELPVEAPKPSSLEYVPAPEECECRDWAKGGDSDPNLHHPTCQWFDAWNLRASGEMVLCDIDGTYRRPATTDEVAESEKNKGERGAPFVTIDKSDFIVLPRADVLSAADAG